MRRSILSILGGILTLAAAGQTVALLDGSARLQANAEPAELLAGCGDVPEAVALAQTLETRAARLDTYAKDIARRKSELAAAEKQLTETLVQLRKVREQIAQGGASTTQARSDDIARMIALYDQMKPAEAAMVISNLPPDFAAQILMRIEPGNGARIMSAVDPAQAALLTSYMGAHSARN